jgi:hypothetical protein
MKNTIQAIDDFLHRFDRIWEIQCRSWHEIINSILFLYGGGDARIQMNIALFKMGLKELRMYIWDEEAPLRLISYIENNFDDFKSRVEKHIFPVLQNQEEKEKILEALETIKRWRLNQLREKVKGIVEKNIIEDEKAKTDNLRLTTSWLGGMICIITLLTIFDFFWF